MNDSSKNPTGVFWLVVLIVGFILFAQYAVVLASGVHDHKVSGKTSQLLSEYNEPKKSK